MCNGPASPRQHERIRELAREVGPKAETWAEKNMPVTCNDAHELIRKLGGEVAKMRGLA